MGETAKYLQLRNRFVLVAGVIFLASAFFQLVGPFLIQWGSTQVGSAAPLGVLVGYLATLGMGLTQISVVSIALLIALAFHWLSKAE